MKDTLDYGYRNFRETIALKWGRHYRITPKFKAILGRDENENENLMRFAHADDYIMQLSDNKGPTLILKGENPSDNVLTICASLIRYFSKYKKTNSPDIIYWKNTTKNQTSSVSPSTITEKKIEEMHLI